MNDSKNSMRVPRAELGRLYPDMSADEINARLERIMSEAFAAVWQLAESRKLSLRTAAFVVGCSRVLEARATRGLYP